MAYLVRGRVLRSVALRIAAVLLSASMGAMSAQAQSALDGFDPNANGLVRVIVVQPDGKILIGGDFTSLSANGGPAVTRNRIARLNHDGTLDAAFNPNASGPVYAIAFHPDGKIIVGGNFATVGGQSRENIARLGAVTGAVDSFTPNANAPVYALAVQGDGKIVVGGMFFTIGGQTRPRIARLDPATGFADSFLPRANNTVTAVAIQPDGRILLGGDFTSISPNGRGTVTRNHIARVNFNGTLDHAFDPNANGSVIAIAIQTDGKVLAGGAFTMLGGQMRNRIARLDAISGAPDALDPNANGTIRKIALQSDGWILVGGDFNGTNSIGGQTRNRIARLNEVTGVADSSDPNADGSVDALAIQGDGKILVGGDFTSLAPSGVSAAIRNRIVRLETDGRLDQTFDPGANGQVITMVAQPDGKIVVGGLFTRIGGGGLGSIARNYIARLNPDGTVDPTFNPGANDLILALALQPDGKILVSGYFSRLGGGGSGVTTRESIGRLNPDGTLDTSFNPGANDVISNIVLQTDGKILVSGGFSRLGGGGTGSTIRNYLGRLHPDGTVDMAFDPGANASVSSVALQSDGKILVGGQFTMLGGGGSGNTPRNYLGRLHADGTLDASFNPGADQFLFALAVQPDNKILVGGFFTKIGGGGSGNTQALRIARLHSNGTVDATFTAWTDNWVDAFALQADGKIVIGGYFCGVANAGGPYIPRTALARLNADGSLDSYDLGLSGCGGQFVNSLLITPEGKLLVGSNSQMFTPGGPIQRNYIGRFTNSASAQQQLAVVNNGADILWQRGGAAPEIDRTVFEVSTDGSNYNPLPSPVRIAGGWQLTGQSLPTGYSFVRARGHYSAAGFANRSGSIFETVRSVFRAGPLQLAAAVSRKSHGTAGDFDIPLPLSGTPGLECRSSGNAHTVIFSFSNAIVGGSASVTAGTDSITGNLTLSGSTMTVNLTGVADVQRVVLTLNNVTDSFGQVLPDMSVPINFLIGDTNGNKAVNASDVSQTKAQSGATVTSANFRQDVTPTGTINASDVGLVKTSSGHTLP